MGESKSNGSFPAPPQNAQMIIFDMAGCLCKLKSAESKQLNKEMDQFASTLRVCLWLFQGEVNIVNLLYFPGFQ